MQIGKVIKNLNSKYKSHIFSDIKFNSKKCKKNDIFVSIQGNKKNGNLYINQAIKNGARTIISNLKFQGIKDKTLYVYNKHPRKILAEISNKIYSKKPNNIVAVTGTNGKSSVANFYQQICELNNIKSASIGTLGVKGKSINIKTTNTTLDPVNLNKILEKLKKRKINNVILEASSHGLHQQRLNGIRFDTGIFTNFSRDHLDYHKSYTRYLDSKLILFKKLLKKKGLVVFDNEISEAIKLKNICRNKKLKQAILGDNEGFKILSHTFIKNNQIVKFKFNNKEYSFETKLIGNVQIKNLMMAIIAASRLIPISNIVDKIKKIKPVNGRFEMIGQIKNNSRVILDYSHTPEALRTCIKNIKKQFSFSRIFLVFGCGGDRDKIKRSIMGRIANELCDKIFLTDDNPRNEDPKKIRNQIKEYINKKKLIEISSRENAIKKSIFELKSGDVLIVAGKGHENYQQYKKKIKFSDKSLIKRYITLKNNKLSSEWKTNILNENLKNLKLSNKLNIQNASINSNTISKNSIFFGIKGKKLDGNKFANAAIKNGAVLSIVDKNFSKKNKKKIKVKNSLKTFSKVSKIIREVSNIQAIGITGSAGKTSFKDLLGNSLEQLRQTTYSKKSFNNKFGVPLSLFQIKKKHEFGVFEIGMDKHGEIESLTKLVRPNVAVITNISHAHIKNFKNINDIAKAKSEIIDQIKEEGIIVLNKDDKFYNYFANKAKKRNIKIITYSKNKKSDIQLYKIKYKKKFSKIYVIINKNIHFFQIKNNLVPYVENILGVISILSIYFNIEKISKKIFYKFQIPPGRGKISKIKLKNKVINLIDESYNSNPLSLNFSIKKFNNINVNKSKKIVILGDMMELGKFSKKLHVQVSDIINNSNIDKVHVYGKHIRHTLNKIQTQKKGKIFNNKNEILNFIQNKIGNNNYLMVKGSHSTGLNTIVSKLKSI